MGAIVLLGCGRLGSAILEGWLATGAVAPERLIVLTPSEKPAALAARAQGARLNPPPADLAQAEAVVLAVKPAKWREALGPLLSDLPDAAVMVSVMAGVAEQAIVAGASGRSVVRLMPTTAVAQGKGVAALWSSDPAAARMGHALFDPIADVADLSDEAQFDAATAVAGCAPAFIYAFVEALARAGVDEGLDEVAARRLARGALRSAGAGEATGEALEALIDRVASPGGVTRAGLDALAGQGLDRLTSATVAAAIRRSREMG